MKKILSIVFASTVLLSATCFAEENGVPIVDANGDNESAPVVEFNQPVPTQQYVVSEEKQNQDSDDLVAKVEALQQQIQSLQGQLEVQAHELKVLTEQQKSFYKDLDGRLSQVGAKAAASNVTAEAATTTVKSTDPEGQNAYRMAYSLVRAKQYTQAITALEAFTQAYPKSPFLPNAHYWLGELYLSQTQYDKAIEQFSAVVKQFPESNKAAGAQLKLGFAYYDKSNWQKAREELNAVKQKFPDTSVAQVAKARLYDMERQGL